MTKDKEIAKIIRQVRSCCDDVQKSISEAESSLACIDDVLEELEVYANKREVSDEAIDQLIELTKKTILDWRSEQ